VVCPSCGTSNSPGRKFCGGCAAPLELVCPACGTANEPGMRFCGACAQPLTTEEPAAPAAPVVAERRLVSVLFADLVGFTTLSESRDPEDVREILSRYFDTCKRLIALYGGTVEKFIGDAVMAVWGAPVATEDDAERAVRAALDLVAAISSLGDELAAPLQARAGVLTGEAAVTVGATGEGMVAGDLVNTAARIQSAAEPGTVFVGDATRRATERSIAYLAAGEHELKGKAEPITLWRALRVVSGVGGQLRSQGLEAPFVGRDRELQRMKETFHACADERRSHLVSVTGIAGIGKSRLGWEFYKYFDGIVEQVWWHRGRCLAYGEGVAYWALADMIRMRCRIGEDEAPADARRKLSETLREQLLDEDERRFVEPRLAQLLGIAETESSDKHDLFAAWRLFFERLADSNPVVLLFEDLQWADASLLDFIEYLLDWSRNHPLLVVTLARPELMEARPTWGAGQRNFTSIYLDPLPQDAMTELLGGLVPGLPDDVLSAILARAEGVPLYAVETVRMLLDRQALVREGDVYRQTPGFVLHDVPETLQALIAARLDGLSEPERRLLQVGAVLGKTFTRPALARLVGGDEESLESVLAGLARKEVLSLQADPRSPEHGQYGFLQDLVRRVAYDTLARRERKALHLQAAEVIGAGGNDEEFAEVIASHLVAALEAAPQADDADHLRARAADALVGAGERAASLGAAAEAFRYFEQAAELAPDEAARARLVARAGEMAYNAALRDQARALLEEACATFATLGDARGGARPTSLIATIEFEGGHPPRAVALLEPVHAALSVGEPDAVLAEVAAQIGRFLIFTGDYERAAKYLEEALVLAELLDLPETFVHALNSKSIIVLQHDRPRESLILLEGALEIALREGLHDAAFRAYNNRAVALWSTDRWRENLANVEEALDLARRVGHRNWEANFVAGSINTLDALGRWDEALARASEADETAGFEFARGLMLYIVRIHAARGSFERARQLLRENASIADSENPDFATGYALVESMLYRAEGNLDEALAAVDRALAFDAPPVGGPGALAGIEALEVAAARGDLELLRRHLARFESLRPGQLTSSSRAYTARFRARLPEVDTESELRTAERIFVELEMVFDAAVVQLELAEWLIAEGRESEAEPLLAAAFDTFERLGAQPWIERATQTRQRVHV
jgi:class 3 adenylate cyclase/tetratricopeptide (TPR) repeat protein